METEINEQERERGSALPWILLFLILIPVVAFIVLVTLTLGGINQTVHSFDNLLTGRLAVKTDQPAVVTQIRQLSRLETVSYTVEKVLSGGTERPGDPLLNGLLGDRLLFVAHGEVFAGVDLSEMRDQDVVAGEQGQVTLRLPPARILTYRLDNEKSYVYDRQRGLLTKGDPNLETAIRRTAEQEIVQAACQDGVLAKASQNAQTSVRALLVSLGYTRIEFLPSTPASSSGCSG
jgi:hypothetical protein